MVLIVPVCGSSLVGSLASLLNMSLNRVGLSFLNLPPHHDGRRSTVQAKMLEFLGLGGMSNGRAAGTSRQIRMKEGECWIS